MLARAYSSKASINTGFQLEKLAESISSFKHTSPTVMS